jgi:hypothetical protein
MPSTAFVRIRRGEEMNMRLLKTLFVTGALAVAFLNVNTRAERRQEPPSIAFGLARVTVGMTIERVEKNLAESGRHLEPLGDKHSWSVCINNIPMPDCDEGEVVFFDGHVAYAMFQLPVVRTADQLAKEIASAVENMDTNVCVVRNYSSHGTGGGTSGTIFDCGSKSFELMTSENLGDNEHYTNVNITIGAFPHAK